MRNERRRHRKRNPRNSWAILKQREHVVEGKRRGSNCLRGGWIDGRLLGQTWWDGKVCLGFNFKIRFALQPTQWTRLQSGKFVWAADSFVLKLVERKSGSWRWGGPIIHRWAVLAISINLRVYLKDDMQEIPRRVELALTVILKQ